MAEYPTASCSGVTLRLPWPIERLSSSAAFQLESNSQFGSYEGVPAVEKFSL